MDGYTESFFFRFGDKSNTVHSVNLLCCDDDDLRAETIKRIHKQITDILVGQGFEKEFFLLYKPRIFGESEVLGLEDALESADKYLSDIEYCEETGDAFIFYNHEMMETEVAADGGIEPLIILKRGGRKISCLQYNMEKEEFGLKQEDSETIEEYEIK